MAGTLSQALLPEELLRTYSGRIHASIQSLFTLAEFAYSNRLVGDAVINDLPSMTTEQAKTKLLGAVRATIKTSDRKRDALITFIQCLEQTGEPGLKNIASEMRASLTPGRGPTFHPTNSPPTKRPRLESETHPLGATSLSVSLQTHATQDTPTDVPHIAPAIPSHSSIGTQQQSPPLSSLPIVPQNQTPTMQPSQEATVPLLPAQVQTYVNYLKAFYSRNRFPSYFKKPSLEIQPKDFIKVKIVHFDQPLMHDEKQQALKLRFEGNIEHLYNEKESLTLDKFSTLLGTQSFSKVLVEGVPGVGKTTFGWELCWQWKEAKLLKEFEIVLLAQVRTDQMRNAITLQDIVYHPNESISEAVVEHLRNTNGQRVLIILEGYDEASLDQQSRDSIFSKLLEGTELPYATVLVTSRPAATHVLPEAFHRGSNLHRIEIVGFTENEIDLYIESALHGHPDILASFKSYLDSNPLPHSLMYIPLQCAILTELYAKHWRKGDKDFAPKTMTELYTALVMSLLLRYLSEQKGCSHQELRITKYSELPEDVYKKLMGLAKTAAEGIEQRRYSFTDLPDETMGLMQKMEELYPNMASGVVTQTFLHHTLQEYLAALHYSETSSHQLQQLLLRKDLFPIKVLVKRGIEEEHMSSGTRYHWPVIRFLAGLTKLHQVGADFLKSMLSKRFDPAFSQLLYEAQNVELAKAVFANSEFEARGSDTANPMHWYVYGFSIAYSSHTANWRVHMVGSHENHLRLFEKGLKLCQRGCISRVEIADMESSPTLVDILNRYSHSITSLWFWRTSANQAHVSNFVACFPSLHRLHIASCDLNGWLPFLALLSNFSALEELQLTSKCKVTGYCPPQCLPALKKLIANIYLPFIVKPNISTLHTLDFKSSRGNSDVTALSHDVQSPHCHVKELEIELLEKRVSPAVKVEFLQAVARNKSLHKLKLIIFHPSHDVIAAFARLLKHQTTLAEVILPLSVDSIEGVLLLVEAMKESSIAHLKLCLSTVTFSDGKWMETISKGRWMEILRERSFPEDRITVDFYEGI